MNIVKFEGVNGRSVYVNPEYVVSLRDDNIHRDGGEVRHYVTIVQMTEGHFKIEMPIDDVLNMLGGG